MEISNTEILSAIKVPKAIVKSQNNTLSVPSKFIKRFFDILFGIIGSIMLVPLTICIYISRLVLHENRGSIFYTQTRIGKDGKKFKLYKFRTMVVDADQILDKYLEENEKAKEEYRANHKLANDPRITKTGKILRKTSLDEMPQFINVLKGEMSLVGPRPYLPKEKQDMGEYYEDIIKVKPGLTGLWQVSGAGHASFKERLELEKYYANKHSIKEDIKLFLKTFRAVIGGHGAGV